MVIVQIECKFKKMYKTKPRKTLVATTKKTISHRFSTKYIKSIQYARILQL